MRRVSLQYNVAIIILVYIVDILYFISTSITPGSQLVKVNYAFNMFNLETLIYVGDLNFTNHLNFQSLKVVYRGNFEWEKISIE